MTVEIVSPLVSVCCSELEWGEDLDIIENLFAVEPRVTVVELEHIDAFFYCIY